MADTEGTVAEAYGVLRGYKLVKIASRQSFLVDPEGRIAKRYEKAGPERHASEVLEDLKALKGTALAEP